MERLGEHDGALFRSRLVRIGNCGAELGTAAARVQVDGVVEDEEQVGFYARQGNASEGDIDGVGD